MEGSGGGTATAERPNPPSTGEPGRGGFEVYPFKRDPAEGESAQRQPTGEYGWRFRSANGQITATGGEGFTREEDAERAIRYFAGDVVKAHSNLEIKRVED